MLGCSSCIEQYFEDFQISNALLNIKRPSDFLPPHPIHSFQNFEEKTLDGNIWWAEECLIDNSCCFSQNSFLSNLELTLILCFKDPSLDKCVFGYLNLKLGRMKHLIAQNQTFVHCFIPLIVIIDTENFGACFLQNFLPYILNHQLFTS